MHNLLSDLRYAVRLLNRNRGFAATAILTLAIGIGANGAIFAVVHGVLFRDLPYAEPDRIVAVLRPMGQSTDDSHAAADFLDLERESRSFEALAAYRMDVLDLSGTNAEPERVSAAQVTAPFFDVFGVAPVVGRTFTALRDDPRGERLVVLGHGLWQRRFGGDRSIVGRSVRVNREPCTVLGVMPSSFRFPGDAEAWVMAAGPVPSPPLAVNGELLADRQVHYFSVVARLKAGRTVAQARAELSSIAGSLARRYPQNNAGRGLVATPLREVITRDARAGLFVLLGAVAFVLLVACANVAGLVLARATGRQHELAMRAALGASRVRVVRQLLTESLVVGLLGGVAGLLFASWGLDLLVKVVPENFPRLDEVGLDATITLFTVAAGAGTALLFGILPALQSSRTEITPALRAMEIRAGARGPGRAMSALVVLEVVVGLVLAVGAGLMVNTLVRLQAVDPGYRPEGVVRVGLPLPATRYGTSEQQARFYTQVLEKLSANPATRLATFSFPLPLSGASASGGVQVEGRPWVTDRERPVAAIAWVSPGYFKVLAIPLRRGRDLDEHDVRTSPLVAVISETAASRLWPAEDPIGQRFGFGDRNDPAWITVVGVVGDVRQSALSSAPAPMLYFPIQQNALPLMSLLVRSDAGAGAVASAVRAAVRQIDPELPVGDVEDFSLAINRSLGGQRLRATLLSGFAAAAVILAAIGVYGLLSHSVGLRSREIGIRLALGAAPAHVCRGVVVEGMKLALLGIALGIPASLGLSRLIATQLFGVGAGDPLTLGGVSLLLLAVAFFACWLPARRVLRIDPVVALRAE